MSKPALPVQPAAGVGGGEPPVAPVLPPASVGDAVGVALPFPPSPHAAESAAATAASTIALRTTPPPGTGARTVAEGDC